MGIKTTTRTEGANRPSVGRRCCGSEPHRGNVWVVQKENGVSKNTSGNCFFNILFKKNINAASRFIIGESQCYSISSLEYNQIRSPCLEYSVQSLLLSSELETLS